MILFLTKKRKSDMINIVETVLNTQCNWTIKELFAGNPAERRAYQFAMFRGFRLTALFIVLRNNVASTTTTVLRKKGRYISVCVPLRKAVKRFRNFKKEVFKFSEIARNDLRLSTDDLPISLLNAFQNLNGLTV
jgi:hypothetical protein